MKFLVLNGVNLNMLGIREKELYGERDFKSLEKFIKKSAKKKGVKVVTKQSNCEGKLCEYIQKAYKKFDGIIINPGAYTHTSVALLDALKAVNIPTVEVHLTDVDNREDFRKTSYVSLYAFKKISGQGFDGYKTAIDELIKKLKSEK